MVKKIEQFQFTKSFKKQLKSLPKSIQKSFEQKLVIFLETHLHPSLRVKRIQGTENLWEGSITMKYRFTFQYESDDTVIFRSVGTHDILDR